MSSTHGWIDGVPLELRPRYYPKPPLKFKDFDIYIPLDALENDYDFTEERRVLVECKMWEEEKEKRRLEEEEKKRLQEEEEEKKRLQAEEEERLRLEKEEEEEIKRLEKEASVDLDDKTPDQDQETSVTDEEKKDESSISQQTNHNNILQHSTETVLPVPLPPIQNHITSNGYNYMMGSDMQMPMYHQTGQNYYNYFVQQPQPQPVVAPIAPVYTVGQHNLPHPTPAIPTPPAALQYQSASAGATGSTGGESSNHSGSVLQSHFGQPTHTGTHVPLPIPTSAMNHGCDTTPVAPLQYQSTTVGGSGSDSSSNHSGSIIQSHFVQSTPAGAPVPLPTTTATAPLGRDTTSAISPVPVYQSTNLRTSDGDNNSGHSGSVLQPHYVQPTATPAVGTQQVPLSTTTATASHCSETAPAVPPVSMYQSANIGSSAGDNSVHSGTVLQSHYVQSTPAGSQAPIPSTAATNHGCDNSEVGDNSSENSFTKLHFPFLTSMAASSRSTRDRENSSGLGSIFSSYSHSYLAQSSTTPHHPSSDELASQNPFLSSYVQSRSPMQRHQYWPTSQLPPQLSPHQQQSQNPYSAHATVAPLQNGPVQSGIGASNFITTSGPSTAPPTGSQHALR